MQVKKYLLLLATSVLFLNFATAQIYNPVKWTWHAKALGNGEYDLVFNASIEKPWHVYGMYMQLPPDGIGPTLTTITYDENNKDFKKIGKAIESGGTVHDGYDKVFGMNVKYFENGMNIVQKIKVLKDTKLKGTLDYGCCDDKSCLPPDYIEFEFDLKADAKAGATFVKKDSVATSGLLTTTGSPFDSVVQATISENIGQDSADAATTASIDASKFGAPPVKACGTDLSTDKQGLLSIIILGFLGGLVALVTPCVFPMIPLTVSFFTKRSETKAKGRRDAFFYSFSIVFIYFLLALPFLFFDVSPDTLNEISTGAPLNIFFFVIFVVFAFSFFGFYEITLPSFIANKADSASNVGGMVGIFFMALTLAIVSFSCTGPILGSLLVGALTSSGGKLNLVAGMTSFGLALALPFGLFALFPDMMKSLPKSGGWLNSVKVVLGFVELIFAVKFLSNADLVAHWGILKREVFLGIWVILGLCLFIYLIGLPRFKSNQVVEKLSPLRLFAAFLAFIFTAYSAYGIPGNKLDYFSGFPPPMFYSIFETKTDIEPIHNDYAAAIERAKAEGKPIMLDFTGWACVNCRKMEENVWPDLEVKKRLTEQYVVVSLYVDDKRELPESEKYISKHTGKKIRTVGNKFSDMESAYFKNNTQPFYVLITPDEKLLNYPKGYTPDKNEYIKFLDCGLEAFKEHQKQM